MTSETMHDVAIIGLGPVGAVLGNLLGAAGLDVVIFERDADILPIPRAVAFDGEIMRVYQATGLTEALQPYIRASTGGQYIDPDGNVMLRRAPSDEEGRQGWRNFYNFHQPNLERTLRAGLDRYPNVAVHLRHDVYAIDEADDAVTLRVENSATGALFPVRARFVVGCDGARSLVRRLIGGTLDDLGLHEPWVVADFALKRDVAGLPETSTQFCDTSTPTTFVRVIENRRRFEFKLPKGADLRDVAAPARVWERAARWITPDDADLERAALYTFHSLIAKEWRRGRLIVAGDAAHQTPPFMGQGLCAGIRDAANLAWKLERILHHGAPVDLLDSYGSERIAHATVFIGMAVHLGKLLGAGNADHMRALAAEIAQEGGNGLVHPTPMMGPGVHDGSPGAGIVAPQPRLASGDRLDESVGYAFALIGEPAALGMLTTDAAARLAAMGVVCVPADGAVAVWLGELGRSLVLVRPDRYVLASLEDADAVARRLPNWEAALGSGARSSIHADVPLSEPSRI